MPERGRPEDEMKHPASTFSLGFARRMQDCRRWSALTTVPVCQRLRLQGSPSPRLLRIRPPEAALEREQIPWQRRNDPALPSGRLNLRRKRDLSVLIHDFHAPMFGLGLGEAEPMQTRRRNVQVDVDHDATFQHDALHPAFLREVQQNNPVPGLGVDEAGAERGSVFRVAREEGAEAGKPDGNIPRSGLSMVRHREHPDAAHQEQRQPERHAIQRQGVDAMAVLGMLMP